jgi:hypothetical protein
MVRSKEATRTQPPAGQTVFTLTLDGRASEELLETGNYDWVSDYASQILHSKPSSMATRQDAIEIMLLDHDDWRSAFTHLGCDRPEATDALRFGERYPDEQCKAPIVFPHEPWAGPHGPSFVLLLRSYDGKRGLSYALYSSSLDEWWPSPRIAVRRRGGARTGIDLIEGIDLIPSAQ